MQGLAADQEVTVRKDSMGMGARELAAERRKP
jgi:hypothetical protein